MKKRRHVNGYIPTFVRQINFVKDNRLLEMFLTNPSDIYKLFHPEVMKFDCPIGHSDKDYRVFFGRLARKNESIVHMARAGCTDDIINGNISDLESDILKVSHHGSTTSSTLEFLYEVKPEYAIISVGENNPYGHPKPVTLSKLRFIDAEIYRTDTNGTILVITDGKDIQIKTNN